MPTTAPPKPKTKRPTRPALSITNEQLAEAESAEASGGRDSPESSLSPQHQDAALMRLLHPTNAEAARWCEFRDLPATTDGILRSKLQSLWLTLVKCDDLPSCASSLTGNPVVWFGQTHTRGTPSLSGEPLYDSVRRVLKLPAAPDDEPTALLVPSPPSAGERARVRGSASSSASQPSTKPNPSKSDLMAGIIVLEERDVPYADIHRSASNPRQSFDETLIAEMAPNIVTICQLNPLTIREGTGELIDGETRHRAGARAPSLRCKIVRCTDAQAACIRLMTSIQRRDLNAIERAKAIVALQQQHGLSQRQMLELLDLKSQGAISNITRLLDLPEIWQQRVMSGEITPTAARELVPWADEPTVLAAINNTLTKHTSRDEWSVQLSHIIESSAQRESRPLKSGYYYDHAHVRNRSVDLKPTPEQSKALRIRKVFGEERAFNVALWEELQSADEKTRAAKEAKRNDKVSGKTLAAGSLDPAKAKENAKKQADQLAKRLYRFKIAWLQAQCLSEIETARPEIVIGLALLLTTREGKPARSQLLADDISVGKKSNGNPVPLLESLTRRSVVQHAATALALVRADLAAPFDSYHSVFTPPMIEALAVLCGIDLKPDWQSSFDDEAPCAHLWNDFVGLWSKDQVIDLLDEWKIKTPEIPDRSKAKRSDLIEYLVANKPCPQALLAAKKVSLT